MGLTQSTRRNRFNTYRFLARNLITPISEIVLLKEAFCGLPGTKLSKLKNLYSEVFTKTPRGRLMVFLLGNIRPRDAIKFRPIASERRSMIYYNLRYSDCQSRFFFYSWHI